MRSSRAKSRSVPERILYRGATYRRAQDEDPVDEAAMVEELEQEPAEQWRDYLQPIIRALKQSLGAEVSLLGPRMGNPYSSPQYGFVITGHVGFPQGRPADVAERFGDRPVEFRAYVSPDGTLIQPIEIG